MPAVDLNRDVPGYREAARREDELRAVPFLGLDEYIAGVPVKPLTRRMVELLLMVNSPFMFGLTAEQLVTRPGIAADAMLFLWMTSPQFTLTGAIEAGWQKRAQRFCRAIRLTPPSFTLSKRDRFLRRNSAVMQKPALTLIQDIIDYIDEAFLDAGESIGETKRSYYSSSASITGFFHRTYGLPMDVWECSRLRNFVRRLTGKPNPLDVPLKIAYQLIRVHRHSLDGEIMFHNRLSQPKVDAWLKNLNNRAN